MKIFGWTLVKDDELVYLNVMNKMLHKAKIKLEKDNLKYRKRLRKIREIA